MTENEPILHTLQTEAPLPGVTVWRNSGNGFRVVDLEYKADPRKRDPEWVAQARRGMPRQEFEREFGRNWVVYDGKPVYEDYDEEFHLVKGALWAPRRAKLVSGWDAGPNDVHLAWVLLLVYVQDVAAVAIDEYYVDDGDTHSFVQVVHARLQMEWFRLTGGFATHVADQSVFTKSGVADGKAVADIMRQFQMFPIPGEISFAKRRRSVNDLLTQTYTSKEGKFVPRLRVHERCTKLREALGGGYAYPKASSGIGGNYKPMPIKNEFSHVANALEYATSRLTNVTSEIPYEGRPLPRMNVV